LREFTQTDRKAKSGGKEGGRGNAKPGQAGNKREKKEGETAGDKTAFPTRKWQRTGVKRKKVVKEKTNKGADPPPG